MPQLELRRIDRALTATVKDADTIIRYTVVGLPHGEQATIFRFGSSWQILRAFNDVSGDWDGPYATAEQAVTALQRDYPDVKPCPRRGHCAGRMVFRDKLHYPPDHVKLAAASGPGWRCERCALVEPYAAKGARVEVETASTLVGTSR
jgi:hypothetical protein